MQERVRAVAPGRAGHGPRRLVGTSQAVEALSKQIAVAGRGRFPVWISGEDGVDKELIAALIHEASSWATGECLSLDAAVIPEPLLARELFGAEEGAIPSLPAAHEGALIRAKRGTVLLEGTQALPKDIQETLTQMLKSGSVSRVGSMQETPLESRLIAAGTADLRDLMTLGRVIPEFAERMRLLEIQIPPLRDRGEDILPIAGELLAATRSRYQNDYGNPCPVLGFSAAALERLGGYSWPGNERELREQISGAIMVAKGTDIQPEALLFGWDSPDRDPPFRDAKRAFEKEYVIRILRMCRGNISRAARIAQKDRKDFYDVMRRNFINPKDFRR